MTTRVEIIITDPDGTVLKKFEVYSRLGQNPYPMDLADDISETIGMEFEVLEED